VASLSLRFRTPWRFLDGHSLQNSLKVHYGGFRIKVSNTNNVTKSILPAVAKQEGELLERIRASEEEAQGIVEKARTDARSYRQEREESLASEVARIRGESEEKRLSQFQSTVGAAEEKLVAVRESSLTKVPEMADKVLALFLPNSSGGA